MILIFRGGAEMVKMVIDRDTKQLQVASSKTNYTLMNRPWRDLFDPGKEEAQEKASDEIDDSKFVIAIRYEMSKKGYQLVHKEL